MSPQVAGPPVPWRYRLLWAAAGCLIALAVVSLVLAILLFSHAPRALPQTSVAAPVSAPVPQVPSLDTQLADIAAARRQGVPRSAWIAATEPDLSAWLAREVAGQGAQVKQVTLDGNNAVIVGTYPLAGRAVDVTVTLLPSAENGRLNLEVQEAYVGRLPMPPGLKVALQRQLDKTLEEAFRANPDVRVDSVGVRDHMLIIIGAIGVR